MDRIISQPGTREGERSVHLRIDALRRSSDAYVESASIFEPQTMENRDITPSAAGSLPSMSPAVRAPEKKLTLFALRLAVLEKAATSLGTLGFIWATVVLLGGFAITLDKSDFWFITIILLIEGARIFSRSHELEWQHQATWTLTDAGITSFRFLKSSSFSIWRSLKSFCRTSNDGEHIKEEANGKEGIKKRNLAKRLQTRRWESSDVPLLPYAPWVFLSKNISKIFHWLQIAAAIACVVLSTMKLIMHNYGEVQKGDTDKRNRKSALYIFYSLALSEALLFLLEKVYWELKVIYCKVLEEVNNECQLGPSGIVVVRRFFYDAYSKCVDGSVFDGLKMDMVSFAMELLGSNSPDEQLMGVQILRSFAKNERFSDDTLQKIGVTFSTVERLVEMLNWKAPREEEIRDSAAFILSKLAGKKQNSLRVAGIPGAMESISSLLHVSRNSCLPAHEIREKIIACDQKHYGFWKFNNHGLVILKKLARDPDNCGKIGNTRCLLSKIIDFTHAGERVLKDDNVAESQILTIKRSLQVIKMLASSTGTTGKELRREISENVFTITNIRHILRHGEKHTVLQKIAIEILTSLAMEDDATERIGGTGGILRELLNIFLKDEGMSGDQDDVRTAAGEALVMLALESKQNCHHILKLGVLEKLVNALENPLLHLNAARILRNLCTYSTEDFFLKLRGVTVAVPLVIKGIMSKNNKLQEVMVGLAARTFKFMTYEESSIMFERAGIKESELASVLVQILQKHQYPPTKFPRIRRFTIELAIWMMKDKETNAQVFKELELEKELKNVLDTTSELESFNIFSGTVGSSRFTTSMHTLVETALNLLVNK